MSNYQQNGNRRDSRFNKMPQNDYHISKRFNPEWISQGVDEDCMMLCEELAKGMAENNVSSSFLRNIFGEICRIDAGGFNAHHSEFVLLRPKLAYTCSRAAERNDKAKTELNALQELYKLSAQEVVDSRTFKNLVSIMEAMIAFHKANGGNK